MMAALIGWTQNGQRWEFRVAVPHRTVPSRMQRQVERETQHIEHQVIVFRSTVEARRRAKALDCCMDCRMCCSTFERSNECFHNIGRSAWEILMPLGRWSPLRNTPNYRGNRRPPHRHTGLNPCVDRSTLCQRQFDGLFRGQRERQVSLMHHGSRHASAI